MQRERDALPSVVSGYTDDLTQGRPRGQGNLTQSVPVATRPGRGATNSTTSPRSGHYPSNGSIAARGSRAVTATNKIRIASR